MAQHTHIDININGNSVRHITSFSLSQGIFDHHNFRLMCPAEAIDDQAGTVMNVSKNLIGATFIINIHAIDLQGTLQFSGVITQVEASRYSGHSGDIIISGYSPTILLDNGAHCKSWEKAIIKKIGGDVLKHFPANMLNARIEPANSEILSYTVQYKETAWQFLKRLSASYGEWLLYDGHQLLLQPPDGNVAKLQYNYNLESFDMSLQVRPASFQMVAYDYINSEVYKGKPGHIADMAGLNELGKHALSKSEQFYASQPKQWHNHFLIGKKQLDDFVNVRAAMESSSLVRFKGCSSNLEIKVGGAVSVMGENAFSESDESFGDYRIISCNHYCDGLGNYSNDFTAIPASVKYPPVSPPLQPHCETQSAFVTDNHDPKGLARVRVKFHWMNGGEKSPWLRVTTPHAGGGKGLFMMPETGEEVIVGFEGDSATRPYIIGAVYHGKGNNAYANDGNDVKALQSRSGNKVIMNDKDGSVHIQDSKGNEMMMDGAGNISVKSAESIVLVCGESKLEMKKDGTINLNGKNITTTGLETIELITKDHTLTASGKNNINAANNTISGKNHITGGDTKIDGGNVFIN